MAEIVVTTQPDHNKSPTKPLRTELGLEPLQQCTSLNLRKVYGCKDVCSNCWGYSASTKYTLSSAESQIMYWAKEESRCSDRLCLDNMRYFTMILEDADNKSVIELTRNCGCQGCPLNLCYPSCMQDITVRINNEPIGMVREWPSWWSPQFVVLDKSGSEELMRVRGPCFYMACARDVQFEVNNENEKKAFITRKFLGCCKESFCYDNCFQIDFEQDLDTNEKALIVAAAFLIDFSFYELGSC